MRVSKGGITFQDLSKMSLRQYIITKKAAEINEIEDRLQTISDINAAFSGNNERINQLQKLHGILVGHTGIKWHKDTDAKQRMMRWAR